MATTSSEYTLSDVAHYARACGVDYGMMLHAIRRDAFVLKQFNEWRGVQRGDLGATFTEREAHT